jgi:hypothetical protein
MTHTARLSRSIPFWVLVGGSVVAIGGGVYLLVNKLTIMADTLTDQTATGVEVYPGQIWAVFGALLIGAGLVGLALALTLGALSSLIGTKAQPAVVAEELEVVEVVEPAAAAPAAPVAETVATPAAQTTEDATDRPAV